MKKVLVANIFGIGDVLFTTPLISNLKMETGGMVVDYLCNARGLDVVELNPDIDTIYVYEKDDYDKLWKESKIKFVRKCIDLYFSIKNKKYDVVFDFTLSRRFSFLFKLAGIRRRIGLDYHKRGIFFTDKVVIEGFTGKHVIEYYLDLLKFLRIPQVEKRMKLIPDDKTLIWSKKYMKEHDLFGKDVVAILPGGGASWGKHSYRKRWRGENFSKVADILVSKGLNVIILGSSDEEELCKDVETQMESSPIFVRNNFTLKEYVSILANCSAVLCNDGGPLHIATALKVKTVSVFGPVDEMVYGPYPDKKNNIVVTKSDLRCRPCYRNFKLPDCNNENKCMKELYPEKVAYECLKLFGIEK